MKTVICQILASDVNGCIGKNGDLPWRIPEDLWHFKNATSGRPVIMGRKTYESLPRPLPNRINIIVTRDKTYKPRPYSRPEGELSTVYVVNTIDEALHLATVSGTLNATGENLVYIIGGAEIYKQSESITDEILRTIVIDVVDEGDAFYKIDESLFELSHMSIQHVSKATAKTKYAFQLWKRKTRDESNLTLKFL